MADIDISLIVHAQKNPGSESFCYVDHQDIDNIGKLTKPKDTVNIYAPCFGEPMFPAAYNWASDNSGRFDPEFIDDFLTEKGVDPEEVTHLNIQLLGGEYRVCLLAAFKCITLWESATHYLNRTAVALPGEGVFLDNKRKLNDLLGDSQDASIDVARMMQGTTPFMGQAFVVEEGVCFYYKKRPWGIYDGTGKCLASPSIDAFASEEKNGFVDMLTDIAERDPKRILREFVE